MALNLEEGRGIAFAKTSKAGNEYFAGEVIINGKRHDVVCGLVVHKDGPNVGEPKLSKTGNRQAWVSCEEAKAAELARLQARIEYLQNVPEAERTQ
jgi:hypothetical protein